GTVLEGAPPPIFVNGVRCGDTPAPKPACANGIDDDNDGQTDAVENGGPDPDPGCSGATDASEDSEQVFPQSCTRGAGFFAGDQGLQARLRAGSDDIAELPADELARARDDARRSWIERDLPRAGRGPLDDGAADLAGWTPVHFAETPEGPVVEWCDLRGMPGD